MTYYSVHIMSVRARVNQGLAAFQEHMKDFRTYMIREKLELQLQRYDSQLYVAVKTM